MTYKTQLRPDWPGPEKGRGRHVERQRNTSGPLVKAGKIVHAHTLILKYTEVLWGKDKTEFLRNSIPES